MVSLSQSHTQQYALTWKHTCARSRWCVYVWWTGRLNSSLTRLVWIDSFTLFSQTTLGEFHLELDLKSDHNAKITSHTEPISYHMHGPSSPHQLNFPRKCRKKHVSLFKWTTPSIFVCCTTSIHLFPDMLFSHTVCKVEDKQLVKARASSHSV